MSKALNHFKNVTFQLPNVEKMYSQLLGGIDWPKNPFTVMDVGCGSGRVLLQILEPLLPPHYEEIVGIDISEEMISVCKTLKTDPRISFVSMDIEQEVIPKKFHNRFNYISSCFVLHYAKDLGKALFNCNQLLKVNGEMVLIFLYGSNPLFEAYKQMSTIAEWKPYTKQFENYVPEFISKDPLQELKMKFNESGFEVLWSGLNHDPYESEVENFLALFNAMDLIYHRIPEDKKRKYEEDFSRIMADVLGLSAEKQDLNKNVMKYFPTIMVHAKKRS
ncbi:juvenile hormone acid O-methyltransferase-like [Coccinella septempunctata]|uniref:juvenile hormone acid O-methyltransferase-like n=1 Tax=Coccinella septempunctata TaxID=41139 RepID=UPI001D06AFDE|nr:juvenile hormone acid O-methyltransferase-like [Coccinella septempunctata]XP_044749338.1 juvenile hormone acid O-methyltransferase-like [Coccinella septempunctata]